MCMSTNCSFLLHSWRMWVAFSSLLSGCMVWVLLMQLLLLTLSMIVMPLPKWLIHLKIWLYNSLWQPSFLMLFLEFIWIDEWLIKKQADAICTQLTFTISSMGHAFVQWNWFYLLDILPLNHLCSSLPERQLSPLLQIDRMRLKLISMLGDCGLMLQCLFDV